MRAVAPFRVSHIVFDVDGTLVDFDAALCVALDAVAERATAMARVTVTRQMLLDARAQVAADGTMRTLREIRDESFRRVLGLAGVPGAASAATLSALYYDVRDASLRPFDEVEATVAALHARGFTLVAASNGNAELERLPAFDHFAHLHFAERVGVSKPDPRFFALALEATDGRAQTALSVGDRIENDYHPARALGMHAVLVDRDGTVEDGDVLRIASLGELPALVALP